MQVITVFSFLASAFDENPQNGGCLYEHFFLSLFLHFPLDIIHSLHICLVPFSDQLLESDPLLERDAGDPDLKPVKLPDLEELLDF